MKLLLDEMLWKTAKWLRIFGIDTEHAKGKGDDEVLAIAKSENRVLVTKDAPLSARCSKQGLRCVFLKSQRLEEQIAELKTALNLEFTFPNKTRCPACNTELVIVPGSEVSGLVEENVLKRYGKFYKCKGCGKCVCKLTLDVTGPKTVYSGDIASTDENVKPVYDKMPLVKILTDQKIKLEAEAILGHGSEHMKWQPIVLCPL